MQVYPSNTIAIQTQGQSVAALFDPGAKGRISPLGNFTGALDSIEYFYGLAPSPQTNPAGAAIFEAEVVEFTSGCPEVAASLVYLKAGPVNNVTGEFIAGSNVTILKQVSPDHEPIPLSCPQKSRSGILPRGASTGPHV